MKHSILEGNEAKNMKAVKKEEQDSLILSMQSEKKGSAEEGRVINTQTNRR